MLLFLLVFLMLFVLLAIMFWFNKSHNSNSVNTNVFSLIGKDGIVTKDINPIEANGQVKVLGELWSATCRLKDGIKKGTTITVVEVNGVKLLVEPK